MGFSFVCLFVLLKLAFLKKKKDFEVEALTLNLGSKLICLEINFDEKFL